MFAITLGASLFFLARTALLDTAINIPTAGIDLGGPLLLEPLAITPMISTTGTAQTDSKFSLTPDSRTTLPVVDISLVSSGVDEDVTNNPSHFEAALQSVINHFAWASELQVVKAQQKSCSPMSFRLLFEGKDKKKGCSEEAIFQADKIQGKEGYQITLMQHLHTQGYSRSDIEAMLDELRNSIPELNGYFLVEASNDSIVRSEGSAGQLVFRLRRGNHEVLAFSYSLKGSPRFAVYGM